MQNRRTKKSNLSNDEVQSNINFVLEVEKYESLYNFNHKEYHQKGSNDKKWKKIGIIFQMTGAEAKAKWRNLRTCYNRSLKPPASGSGVKPKYYLYEVMKFVLPYVNSKRKQKGNLNADMIDTDDDGNNSNSSSTSQDLFPLQEIHINKLRTISEANVNEEAIPNQILSVKIEDELENVDILDISEQPYLNEEDVEIVQEKLSRRRRSSEDSANARNHKRNKTNDDDTDNEIDKLFLEYLKSNISTLNNSDALFLKSLFIDMQKLDDLCKIEFKQNCLTALLEATKKSNQNNAQ